MVQVPIGGISVDFPREPYSCQVDYMAKVIEALNSGGNALLESPTGTGKTLSLLCSTLAWQKHNASLLGANPEAFSCQPSASSVSEKPGVIVYATRTHSQLSQVIKELGATEYRPKMAVLGSREQLCIHDKVSKLRGPQLNHACHAATSSRKCQYRNNLDSMTENHNALIASNEVTDIEDLVLMGRRRTLCPYFYSRDSSASADIVFMPYNYLLDGSIRKTLKISLQNSIVIFDEAHNLEQVAADAAGCSFTSADLASCIQEMQRALQILRSDMTSKKNDDPNFKINSGSISTKVFGGKADSTLDRPSPEVAVAILKALFDLEKILDSVQLTANAETNSSCAIFPGAWMVNALVSAGFRTDLIIDGVKKCALMLMDETEQALGGFDAGGPSLPTPEPKLNTFFTSLERILYTGRVEHQDFQVFISEEVQKKKQYGGSSHQTRIFQAPAQQQKKRVVNFWCFSTGVALKELKAQGVRSIVLTSGTLSPLEAMKEDLRIPFTIELQNPHVIGSHQVWVGAVGRSSADKSLNSSFASRDTTAYKDELGQSILDISCTLMGQRLSGPTPDSLPPLQLSTAELCSIRGGVLVFFPAYHLMDSTIERWKFTGLYKRLELVAGSMVVETRSKTTPAGSNPAPVTTVDMDGTRGIITGKAGKKLDETEPDQESLTGLIAEFESAIRRMGSCMLLAVCRGKAAEGVDFSDSKGRIVIVTGIPFAPFMDPWIVLKKQYLDSKCALGSTSSSVCATSTPAPAGTLAAAAPQGFRNDQSVYGAPMLQPSVVATSVSRPIPPTSSIQANANTNTNVWANARQTVGMLALPNGLSSFNAYPNSITTVAAATAPSQLTRLGMGLTGQMWYQQSASRAVNQCLGRVIRHKNDWGAIFLLDERFLADRQLSQLSKWMRPWVRKHGRLREALLGFRDYLQHVARDAALRPKPVPGHIVAPVKPQRPHALFVEEDKDVFSRFIEIPESQLPSTQDEPACYIQQRLLQSQQLAPTPSQLPFRIMDALDIDALLSQGTESGNPLPRAPSATGADLKGKLDRLKSRGPEVSLTRANSKLQVDKPTTSPLFALPPTRKPLPIEEHINLLDDDNDSDFTSGGFGLSQVSHASGSFIASQAAPAPQVKDESAPTPAPKKATLKASMLSMTATPSPAVATADLARSLLARWRARLSDDQLQQLHVLLGKTKKIGLQFPTQMKEFIDSFGQIVEATLSLEDQAAALKALSILVSTKADDDESRKEIYVQLVSQRFQRQLKKRRMQQQELEDEEDRRKRVALAAELSRASQPAHPQLGESGPPVTAQVSASSASQGSGGGSSGGGSKRAQQLLQRVGQTSASTAPASSASVMFRLNQISSMEIGARPATKRTVESSAASRLQCAICKEVAAKPCAAKCGHVCCPECWLSWLRVKPECPVCRTPATKATITQVFVRPQQA